MSNSITVNNNIVTVKNNVTDVITVTTQGPQGIQGPSGSQGAGFNSSSYATTGSNAFTDSQTISGSLAISGSVTADNLWYRWTLTNLPLNRAGTYTIVPVTPGYKFVPMKVSDPSSTQNTTCQIENNSDTDTVNINNFIRVGNASDENALGKFTPVLGNRSLAPNQIIVGFDLSGGYSYMVSIDTDPIIVTIDGNGSDTGVIDVTLTGYLKKIV